MLIPVDTDLWRVEHDFTMPGGVHFPGRMLVVRLPDGGLVLVSPVPIDDGLAHQLDALGTVAFIVAPCSFHHLHYGAARQRYPEAVGLGAPGLADKRPDLVFDRVLGDHPAPGWGDALQTFVMAGQPMLAEVVLLHPTSGTLITTDLVFNMRTPPNWQSRLLLWMVGCSGRLAQSRSVRLMTRDRGAASDSAARLLALDFDRLVMAHGDIVETGGQQALAQALSWLTGDVPQLQHASSG